MYRDQAGSDHVVSPQHSPRLCRVEIKLREFPVVALLCLDLIQTDSKIPCHKVQGDGRDPC